MTSARGPADFTGKVAVVGGAGGGIGSVVAGLLLDRGASVALVHRSPSSRINELVQIYSPSRCMTRSIDLRNPDACQQVIRAVASELGVPSVVVHAAGPRVPMVHLGTLDSSAIVEQVEHDVAATVNLVQASLRSLRETCGNVVVVTTAATDRHAVRDGLSTVPKGAIEGYVRALAAEEGRFGVRANSVGPGMLTDGMAEDLISSGELDETALASAQRNIPLRDFGRALDVAEAVCFLASDRARYITGQKLNVDGGFSI